jgi:hypothetical protein
LTGRIFRDKSMRIPVKLWMIRAERNFDANRQIGRSRVVVLLQSPAHFACLNANDRILPGRVIGVPVEDFGPDGAFLQELMASLEAMAYYV